MNTKPTREQVLAEPAGRQIDAWVALYVIELPRELISIDGSFHFDHHGNDILVAEIDNYSTEIAAAWQVVEKTPIMSLDRLEDGRWRVWVRLSAGAFSEYVDADSAPLAICKAALLTSFEIGKNERL